MTRLILIKHSSPAFVRARPAAEWELSEEGRARCIPLAEQLRPFAPQAVITSEEPKARQTGEIVARILNLPVQAAPGLHEHERQTVPWYDDYDLHTQRLLRMFDEPDQVVFGEESAAAAYARFGAAVDDLLAQYPGQTLAIATHGTVMTLFAQHRAGVEPKPLWHSLKLPAFIVFALPHFKIEQVVHNPAGN